MTTVVERKFVNLRKRLDQLGYRQPLGVESLPLVEKLFSDLVHTTESLRSTKLSAGKIEKECSNFDVVLEPYREENARLTRENNELHLEVLKLKEQFEEQVKDLKATLRKFEHENSDMKFLNNQYIHKMRSLEKENKAKTDKIQQLQEKNLQAVVQTPGGKKRNIPFRRQRMQIDQPVPPSGIGAYPVPQPNDPYIADLLQVADNRIHELQIEVDDLQEKLEIAEREMKNYSKQVELRDNEIERLAVALDGGRSHDVISLEAKSRSNEKIIDHLNLQVEFLQQTKKDLEKRIEDLLDSRQNMTSEVAHLSNKNEELCQELTEIDHLAQQLERHKEIVLETADKEIGEAKLKTLCVWKCHPCQLWSVVDRELVIELERMRLEGGIALGDKSPSRLDTFVKTIEEDRDYYKRELECLQKIFKRRSSPLVKSPEKNEDLRLVTRERDELQSMLDRFEKHMIEIQSNVKLLTVEKDKLSVLYEQVNKYNLDPEQYKTMKICNLIKTKLDLLNYCKFQFGISFALQLETERLDQVSTVSLLKDKISSLEDELNVKAHQLLNTSEDSAQYKTELNSLKLLNEQIQKSLDEIQHQLTLKENELQSAQEEIEILEDKIDTLQNKSLSQNESLILLRSTVNALDKEKDSLQESIDEKTEKIAYLEDNLANKVFIQNREMDYRNHFILIFSVSRAGCYFQLKDALNGKDRELASLHRQFDGVHSELGETVRVKEMALKENRRLQDDLATMTRENQVISTELEVTLREKEELKVRVHNYITEVSRFESLMALKERENKELLEKFQMLHSQAEDWEVKAHQAEGQNSSVRLELLSVDTERRHLRERVELLEKEIQEHIIAHQTYESQISSMAKNMAKLEEILRREKEDKSSMNHDVSAVRDLCVKLESSNDLLSRQLSSKSLEFERVKEKNVLIVSELLKKQLSSERLTIQNLETLLTTSRDKDFQNHLITHEKDSEIQLLKDKLTLSESKLTSLNREVSILRNKLAQLQTDYDIVKRQLTTEQFERERAIQEMRRLGFSTTSVPTSSPLSSTLRSPSHSPERAFSVTTERTERTEK
uniref:Centrosomal protein 135 n=1 Tax=Pseudonaja textilis TaxID=8673 RepID=A0A670YCB8_PSETE